MESYTDNPYIPEGFDLRHYGSQFYLWLLFQDSDHQLISPELALTHDVLFDSRFPVTASGRDEVMSVLGDLTYDLESRKQVLGGLLDRFGSTKKNHPFIDRVVSMIYTNQESTQ